MVKTSLTDDQYYEMCVLSLMSEKHKFALELYRQMQEKSQYALERLQERGWIRLVDFTPIAEYGNTRLFRIFHCSELAVWFYKNNKDKWIHMTRTIKKDETNELLRKEGIQVDG